MKPILLLIVLAHLAACASKVPMPQRPIPQTEKAANCLRECEAIYATCTNPAKARTPLGSTAGGILIGAIADNSNSNNVQSNCAQTLKPCYDDCQRFGGKSSPAESPTAQ